MVKLQKHKAYTYETEEGKRIDHHKHLVVLPESVISQLSWPEGVELSVNISNNAIVLTPKKESKEE